MKAPLIATELRQRVDPELRPGEKLVWAEQPLARVYRRKAIAMVLFSIPWTAFVVFWMWGASGFQHWKAITLNNPIPLVGLPFLLIGIGMFLSPLILRRKAGRTLYAITNQRALIFEGTVYGEAVRSYPPERLTSMNRIERSDGSGDLVFVLLRTSPGSGLTPAALGFLAVERVREVEELIVRTLPTGRQPVSRDE